MYISTGMYGYIDGNQNIYIYIDQTSNVTFDAEQRVKLQLLDRSSDVRSEGI